MLKTECQWCGKEVGSAEEYLSHAADCTRRFEFVERRMVFLMQQLNRLTEAVIPSDPLWIVTEDGIREYMDQVIECIDMTEFERVGLELELKEKNEQANRDEENPGPPQNQAP